MIESDGTFGKKGYTFDKPGQFRYALYPDPLMDIAMQVINSGVREYPAGADGRLKKTLKASKEVQYVEVVYIKPRDLKHNRYDAYDYVILTMYPVF